MNLVGTLPSSDKNTSSGFLNIWVYGSIVSVGVPNFVVRSWNSTGISSSFCWKYMSHEVTNIPVSSLTANVCANGSSSFHSQGCLIGIDFASKYPKLINKLVLVAGSYMLPVNQDLLDLAEAGDDKAIHLMLSLIHIWRCRRAI